ncbi:MAG: pro-sigmaK processing inhibitor BofA family protein [Alicyclobacillus sp.]|nr:pro-sigmaK processing inhibitor BofA family protein [Alicyclobacillus sp.]
MPVGQAWLWVIALLLVLAVASQVLRHPGQIFWKLVKSAGMGCLMVLAVNWIGGYVHYHLPLNPLTVSAAGLLGIPGVAAMVAVHAWMFSAV